MTQQQPGQEDRKAEKRKAVFDLLNLEHDLEAQEHETATGAPWDPIDSLIYLHRANPLDWVSEQMGLRFGDEHEDENEDVAILNAALDGTRSMLRGMMRLHHDGRKQYSTGVPFERVYQVAQMEPGRDGEPDQIVQAEYHVQMKPDGTPRDPYHPNGVWINGASDEPTGGKA